jgi:hypothetical protein
MMDRTPVNDDPRLEREADAMGAEALRGAKQPSSRRQERLSEPLSAGFGPADYGS